jgi:DNA modification methylase
MMTTTTRVTVTDHWCSWRPLEPRVYYRTSNARDTTSARPPVVPRNRVIVADALSGLRRLPSGSVDCAITSPPYFLLRNYGVNEQIGAEADVAGYVQRILAVCDEVSRVLKPAGTFWLNLGDSYSRHDRYGASPKSLLLAPERILIGLAERGWIVRNKIVWAKPNPMPSSVGDRLTCTWEPLYLLVSSEHYFFDLGAIRQPHATTRTPALANLKAKYGGKHPDWAGPLAGANDGLIRAQAEGRVGHPGGKNPGDVWTIATAGFRGAHFAAFPPRLIERPILAGVPQRVCSNCGCAWRQVHGALGPTCSCGVDWRPGLVLDPFMGVGTVAVVAEEHGRDWLGIELNPTYARLAEQRIEQRRLQRGQDGTKAAAVAA